MRYRKLIPVVAGAVAAAVMVVGTAVAQADVEPQLIGGHSPTHAYPAGAFVSLKYDAPEFGRTNWHTCGAALTFNNLVRTAAHCVTDVPAGVSPLERERLARAYHVDAVSLVIPIAAKDFWVRVGSPNKESGGVIAHATIKWVHPGWNWAVTPGREVDDIAVLELDQYVDVYTLPLAPRPARPGDVVYRLGWGVTLPNGSGPLPSGINELASSILHRRACSPGQPFGITSREVCVGNVHGTDGACFGDSGGPIVLKLGGVWYDAGITSRGTADFCGVADDSYTSTPEFRTEIYTVARGTPARGSATRDVSWTATTSGGRP